jgi:UDP-N-acetylglucosamine:LPS N-acetylglucosamine transferase
MGKAKYTAQIENIYFLSRIGATLRWATQDIGREELPPEVKRLLSRLDRLEARSKAKSNNSDDDPAE